jgi:hypothetical protein
VNLETLPKTLLFRLFCWFDFLNETELKPLLLQPTSDPDTEKYRNLIFNSFYRNFIYVHGLFFVLISNAYLDAVGRLWHPTGVTNYFG